MLFASLGPWPKAVQIIYCPKICISQSVRVNITVVARVTSLLGQQTLTKERLDKHVQGFVRWAKGGLTGLIDPLKARDALLKALDEAGINQLLALLQRQNINRKKWGILWLREY